MPAAVVKGIIVSISIIAALGIAVLENPQVQEWLEEQRRKIADLLRSIGDELDPESRRAAEAFAFEGRTPANDDGLRREATGAIEAAAMATGRSLSEASTVRRIPIQGRIDPEEAEERRRQGKEYLARRNQQMYELQQRRKAAREEGAATPPSPTFDLLVDGDGKLKTPETAGENELPTPPTVEPLPESVQNEMREVERNLAQPIFASEPSLDTSAFERGSHLANPFGDEYDLDRSETPKPPVPPKIELDSTTMPERSSPPPPPPHQEAAHLTEAQSNELSYEEQLALALSLSEAESSKAAADRHQYGDEDVELKAAIAASLREVYEAQTAHNQPNHGPDTPRPVPVDPQPLVDLTPPSPSRQPARPTEWERLFDPHSSPSHEPLSLARGAPSVKSDSTDDLYTATPPLTHARLATLNSMQREPTSDPKPAHETPRNTAASPTSSAQLMEASFYSAPSSVEALNPPLPRQWAEPTSTDVHGPKLEDTSGFQMDSDSDDFRSQPEARSRTLSPEPRSSRPESAMSGVEIISAMDDSDMDMLSEEGDGILTPGSWTEVDSRDGEESETEDGHGEVVAL